MDDRLRIASEQLAGLNSCENVAGTARSRAEWALKEADALIVAAGESAGSDKQSLSPGAQQNLATANDRAVERIKEWILGAGNTPLRSVNEAEDYVCGRIMDIIREEAERG